MPNSTCDFASVLLSANDGDAVTVAAHATRAATGTFIGGSRPLYRTPPGESSKPCATAEREKRAILLLRQRGFTKRGRSLSSIVVAPSAIIGTRRSAPHTKGAAMSDLLEFVSLSLLPPW